MTAAKLSLIKSSGRRLGVWVATATFVLMACSAFAQASPPPKEQKKGSPREEAGAAAEKRAKAKKAAEERGKRRRPPQADKSTKEGEKPSAGKKEKKDEQDADPKAENGEEVPETVGIDANLRRRIDDLLNTEEEMFRQTPAEGMPTLPGVRRGRSHGRVNPPAPQSTPLGTPKPGNPSRSRPDRRSKDTPGEALSGPGTPLNIPAAIESTPPEDRTYFFSIVDGTYAQLIEGIARETGLGVIGAAPKDGKVSFICEEELTFDELLRKVRVLLFHYKPRDPYTLVRHDTHLQVIRVVDYYRELPPSRMYRSVEEYRAAELTPDELVLVVYSPESGSVADLNAVRDFMPDYVLVTPLEDSNSVIIFARVMDIEKYFEVKDKIVTDRNDPRTLKLIPVKYISASEAVEKLGSLMDLDGAAHPSRRRLPTSKGRSSVSMSTLAVAEPEVSVMPDDAQKVIIVRAMPAKIAEIEMLLPFLDVGQGPGYDPVVIEVVHADPAELITTIRQILDAGVAAESTSRISTSSKRKTTRKKNVSRSVSRNLSPTTFADITMIPHPVTNSIIVMADEEKLATVRSWVKRLDVPSGVSNVPVALKHIDADSAVGMITQLLDAGADPQRSGPLAEVIAAPSGNAIWFSGSERDLTRVRELVVVIDTPDEVVSLHIVTLRNQSPIFVANILRQYENEGGITPTAKPKKTSGGKRGKIRPRPRARSSSSSSAGKFTADDDLGRLYILCSEREWLVYKPLIDQLESESPSADFVILSVEHIPADEAVDKFKSLLSSSQVDKIRFETADGQIFVTRASEQDLATIRLLLKEFDVAVETVKHTFEIKYAEPSELVSAIQTLFAEGGGATARSAPKPIGPRTGRKSKGGSAKRSSAGSITIVELGQFLIIETTPKKMEQIAEFITEFDVDDDQREVRVYDDFPPGTDLNQLATDLEALLSGASPKGPRGPKKPSVGGRAAAGPRIVARNETRKMVIFADADAFEEIEKFLEILRPSSALEPVVLEFISVHHADPAEIIELVQPLLDLQIEQFVLRGEMPEFGSAVSMPGPKGKKPRRPVSVAPATSSERYHLSVDERMGRIMVAGPQLIVDATKDLIAQFDIPVDPADRMEIAFLSVENTDPAELVDMIEPFLSLKVDELIAAGVLAGTPVKAPSSAFVARPGPKKGPTPRPRASGPAKAYHLTADEGNLRIVVLAPAAVIDEVRKLVEQFDVAGAKTEIVFRTVELQKAAPSDMVKAIKEIMDVTGRAPGRRKGKGKLTPGTKAMLGISSTDKLVVTEAPGGTALILYGPREDVDKAEEYIVKLDITPEREIKIYQIKHADLRKLVSLIMNDVDTPAPGALKKGMRPQPKKKQDDDVDIFTTEIERIGTNVYIQADLIAKTMVVSAPASKLSRIDGIVAELDRADALKPSPPMPKLFYTLKYTEAFDASFALEMVLEQLWNEPDQLPKVDYATWDEVLIIKYPDESRFPEIEFLIRKYVDKPDPDDLLTDRVPIQLPPKGTPENFIMWLKLKHPELDISKVDISKVEDPTHGVVELKPYNEQASARRKSNPCVLPSAFGRMAKAVLVSVTAAGGQTPDNSGSSDDGEGSKDEAEAKGKSNATKEELPGNVKAFVAEMEEDASFDAAQEVSHKLKAFYDPNTGDLIIEGQRGTLKKLDDLLEEYGKELEKLKTLPDIRILQVRHIDVFKAADIINEMFNATRSQRQAVQAAQRQAQQQAARQRQQQQRAQQQAAKGQGQPGQPTPPGRQPQRPQQQVPQIPADSVRILPNPRDRTLIVRAETTHFPVIMKLLATIDRPQPIESFHRVYHLQKLSAVETEALLKSWLGITGAGGGSRTKQSTPAPRRGGRSPAPQAARRTSTSAPGDRLPRQLIMETDAGLLGVDPHDIKISSNEASNTILVMAPTVALDFIGELIEELDSQGIVEPIWKNFELKHASVEQTIEYLEARFGSGSSTTARSGGKSPRGKKSAPQAVSPGGKPKSTAAFVAYPTLNLISALATEELMVEIEEAIVLLDVHDPSAEFKTVKLEHCDAQIVSDTLTAMFGAAGAGGKPKRSGSRGAAQPSGSGPKFIGEAGSKVVFYSAPEREHDRVLEVIAELEEQCRDIEPTVRIIELQYARPTSVADAIKEAFGSPSSGRRGGSRRGQDAGSSSTFTITGHDPSKRLFVLCDDIRYEKVQSLVTAIDVPQKMDVDFRIYKLQYASARSVYETLKSLFAQYITRLGRNASQTLEAFSVEVDDKANALIVLGGDMAFNFVEKALLDIDIPENARSEQGILMIPLEHADATEVAANINRLWSQQKNASPGETPPQAEANRALNMVIVRGTQDQLDEIRVKIIEPLEAQSPLAMQTETIALQYAQAEDVAEFLKRMFEDMRKARQETRSGSKAPSSQDTAVAITPDAATNQLIIQASEKNMAMIKARVAERDREEVAGLVKLTTRVYALKYGDPNSVVNIVREWDRAQQAATKNRTQTARDKIIAVADKATGSVVVTASEHNQARVKELIDGLESDTVAPGRHVIPLKHAFASELASQLTKIYQGTGGGRGGSGPVFVADESGNAIIAVLNEEQLADVMELIEAIDKEPAPDAQRITKVYTTEYADPNSLSNAITNMFRVDGRRREIRPSEQVTVAAEPSTQSLIVTASPENHAIIAAMIKKVDLESRARKEIHTIKLLKADAEEVAKVLQEMYRGQKSSRRGDQPVQITAEAATNTLLVLANQIEMVELNKLIKQLDVEPDLERGRRLRVFKLVNADPYSIQEAINQLFRGGRDPRDQVTAVPEAGSHSVIVSATSHNMSRVEELITNLDSEATGQQQVHVINLETAEAESVSQTLNEIFVRSAPRQQGSQGAPITISALRGSKAVVVKASAEDFERIEAAIKELDTDIATIGEEVRVVTLLYSDASEIKEAVQEYLRKPGATSGRGAGDLAGDVRLSVLVQTNGVMVSGDKERVDEIEQLIAQMDMAGEKGSVPQVITLTHARVGQVLPTVLDMFLESSRGGRNQPSTVIVANERLNIILVRGSPTEVAAIQSLVAGMDTEELGEQKKFEVIKVAEGINIETLAEMIETTVNEAAAAEAGNRRGGTVHSITVVSDRRTRALIVSGSPPLFDDAVELAATLEKLSPAGGEVVRIITIVNTPKDEVIRLIEQLRGDQGGSSRGASRGGSSRRGGSARRSGGSTGRSGAAARRGGGTSGRSGTPPRRGGSTPRRRPGQR